MADEKNVPEAPNLWNGKADPHVEYAACGADCAYFIDTYCIIDDSHNISGDGTGQTRFRLWPAQVQVIYTLMTQRLIVILKARQLGISWVVCAYVLWRALFQKQFILLYSRGQEEANELLRRIKVLYKRLPDTLKELLPRPIGDSTKQLKLSNGSILKSMPASATAGVGYTASVLVIDEAARIMQAPKLFSDAKPTIDAGGQLIVFSTANGVGGMFHGLWQKAVAKVNGFFPVFLPWWSRPGRDAAWLKRITDEANDPKEIPENYPANPVEAFVASGRSRFPHEWIKAQMKFARMPIPMDQYPTSLIGVPGLRLYRIPSGEPGEQFIISADVAEGHDVGIGGSDPDFSAAHVVDRKTLEQVAVLHGRWEPDVFADYLLKLAEVYGMPEILVERNNHGHAVLALMKRLRYRRIAKGHDGKPGWLTNEVTRESSIDHLAANLRDRTLIVHDIPTLDEMQSFHVNRRGYSMGVQGSHDDLVMGLAILFGYLNHGLVRRESMRADIRQSPLQGYRG